jgi:molybdopterin converting factor small subunit
LFPVVASKDAHTVVAITVRFMSIARQRAGVGVAKFVSQESTLRFVLRQIPGAYGISDIILTDKGMVGPWARVLVNGRSHEFVGGLDIELHNGDNVALIYPYTKDFLNF